MRVNAEMGLIPIGTGVSISEYVAACVKVFREAGLEVQVHANGTDVEGEWDAVMAAVRRCHEVVHGLGAPRINTTLKINTRTDRDQGLTETVRRVEQHLS